MSRSQENNKVCILLASYNGEKYLDEQLKSLVFQTDVEVSIYVSDDHSTDNTLKIIKKYKQEYGNIFFVRNLIRRGSAKANFYHLIKSVNFDRYDFVALCDQDDIWSAEKLAKSIHFLINEQAGLFSSDVQAFWPDGTTKKIVKSQPQKKYDFFFEAAGPGCTYVATKDVFNQFKYFLNMDSSVDVINVPHDWLLYAYCRYKNFKCYIHSETLMLYRQHSNNVMGANVGLRTKILRVKSFLNGEYSEAMSVLLERFGKNADFLDNKYLLIKNSFQFRRVPWQSIMLMFHLLILHKRKRN